MPKRIGIGITWGIVPVILVFLVFRLVGGEDRGPASTAAPILDKPALASHIGSYIQYNEFPSEVEMPVEGQIRQAKVEYGLDAEMQEHVENLLNRFRPDYGAFVAMDAVTGRILSIASFSRDKTKENLALKATFPAASVFKVVTAGAAIDTEKGSPEMVVPFNGGLHTLYRRNVEHTKVNRWTRFMTMREAFARSVNVYFGKLGLFYVGAEDLREYAERFRFNQSIPADVPVEAGYAKIPLDDRWGVVEAASGFTRENTLSPIHGALIAATVANDGVMMEPYLVESVVTAESGESLYQAEPRVAGTVLKPESAAGLRELMDATVRRGTSAKAFRRLVRHRYFDNVEVGGKTGSLTGDNPAGRTDWFVGYARYKGHRLAVAAVTVHERIWRVKSSQLASEVLSSYIRDIKDNERFTAQK